MDKFQLKSQFSENTTKVVSQLDNIWTNVLGNECKFGVTKAYWSNFSQTNLYCIQITKHISNI
jgi:hypothetical protein